MRDPVAARTETGEEALTVFLQFGGDVFDCNLCLLEETPPESLPQG